MPEPIHLGNDIVDRGDARLRGKAGDERFLRRVFTRSEEDSILSAPDPDLALWARWAGKEAAFKSASKVLRAPPVFNHPEFLVEDLEAAEPEAASRILARGGFDLPASGEEGIESHPPVVLAGKVSYRGTVFSLVVLVSQELLHAVSWREAGDLPPDDESPPLPPIRVGMAARRNPGPEWRNALRPSFSEREWACVSHQGSALTRMAARDALAAGLSVDRETLEIGCGPGLPGRRIPRVFMGGREVNVELTLSHHGRYQAWAFRIP